MSHLHELDDAKKALQQEVAELHKELDQLKLEAGKRKPMDIDHIRESPDKVSQKLLLVSGIVCS